MDEYLGTVKLFAGNFAPQGWAFCNGALLSVSQYNALFSILGNTYGGNGVSTFALPDLRGRVPRGAGQGAGLSNVALGATAGTEQTTLVVNNMPTHGHTLSAYKGNSNTGDPTNAVIATPGTNSGHGGFSATLGFSNSNNPGTVLNSYSIGTAGSSAPFSNLNPSLGLNYIICINGIFPSRD